MHETHQSRRWLAAALAAACLAITACQTSLNAVSSPLPSQTGTPSAQPMSSDEPAFDLSGTAWRAIAINGRAIPARHTPWLEFDWLGRPSGTGFTGCVEFGFGATIGASRISIGDLGLEGLPRCVGPGSDVDGAFLASFGAAEAWSVEGDLLTIAGPTGNITFARQLPPVGDPSRELADALRVREWRVLQAPGVAGLDRIPPVRIADTIIIAVGECGFAGDVAFVSGGTVEISELGWDTSAGCGDGDVGRGTLARVLQAVTTGRPRPDGTVVLSGPLGDVVLGH